VTSGQSVAEEFRSESRLTAAYLIVAHVALFIGVVLGLFKRSNTLASTSARWSSR
jgi:hypothetical protein